MDLEAVLNTFWKKNSMLYGILKGSEDPKIAQNHLHNYLSEQWKTLYKKEDIHLALEWDIQMNALRTLRTIISVRSEKLTGVNLVALLWNLAHKNLNELPNDLSIGFFEELNHLFRAISGKSGIYKKEKQPEFKKESGQAAAVLRSKHLNEVARKCNRFIKRYPDGLNKKIISKREENKEKILKVFGGTPEDWNDYTWQLKNVIRDAKTLASLVTLTEDEKKAIDTAKKIGLPFGITPYYVSLMDQEPSRENDHAVRAQVVPPTHYANTMKQYKGDEEYCADFMLERDTSPIELITRRYPFIAIFKPFNTCSQICVYCQRNWQIKDVLDEQAESSPESIENAYEWMKKNKEVEEILVTGGDPLIMNTGKIKEILTRLSKMSHVKRIRIGSRTPVVLPQRITTELADTIAEFHIPGKREIAIVTHFEHVYEITPDSMEAVQLFKKRGISVYNQAVFTVENSRRFELVALRRQLRSIGVDSYYTFNTKGKEETNNYRVPIARLQQEVKEEARLAPGLVRTDEPVYNVPRLGKNYIRAGQHHTLLTILPDGRRVYEFLPWEKHLALVDVYIDTDVSIYDYLQELEKRGEKIDDYKSIWYYY
ncbi:MAG: KamA family radical SAM protein [bacterium]|nr:KamA family radical SAM protein [bacterium]